jgi:hypothetical protein
MVVVVLSMLYNMRTMENKTTVIAAAVFALVGTVVVAAIAPICLKKQTRPDVVSR